MVIEDVANQNNTDEEIDSEKESQFTGGRFFFPSPHQPNDVSGTCSSQQSYIRRQRDAGGIVQKLCVLIFQYVFVTTVQLLLQFPVICTRGRFLRTITYRSATVSFEN